MHYSHHISLWILKFHSRGKERDKLNIEKRKECNIRLLYMCSRVDKRTKERNKRLEISVFYKIYEDEKIN